MKRSNEIDQNYDDRLADFADRALSHKMDSLGSNADEELRGLQETVLRLTRFMPHDPIPQATLKRMKSDFLIRSRTLQSQEQRKDNPLMAFLNRMMQVEINPNIIMTVGAMAVLIGILLVTAFTNSSQPGTLTGTAGASPQITGISIVAGGLFLLIIVWISRRK